MSCLHMSVNPSLEAGVASSKSSSGPASGNGKLDISASYWEVQGSYNQAIVVAINHLPAP